MEQLRMEWDLLFNCFRPKSENEFERVVLGNQNGNYFKDSNDQLQEMSHLDQDGKGKMYVEKSKPGKGITQFTDLISSGQPSACRISRNIRK